MTAVDAFNSNHDLPFEVLAEIHKIEDCLRFCGENVNELINNNENIGRTDFDETQHQIPLNFMNSKGESEEEHNLANTEFKNPHYNKDMNLTE